LPEQLPSFSFSRGVVKIDALPIRPDHTPTIEIDRNQVGLHNGRQNIRLRIHEGDYGSPETPVFLILIRTRIGKDLPG
jgi:hypothetical protein